MQVIVLAGGKGVRMADSSLSPPKPLVEIGGRPVVCHVLAHYLRYGCNDFLIAAGYKGDLIESTLGDPASLERCCSGLGLGAASISVRVVQTGLDTQTGGRLRRLARDLLPSTIMLTYADGLSDVDIGALLAFHRGHGKLATLTAVQPPERFGRLNLDGDAVTLFREKSPLADSWINGGYMVLEPGILDYIEGDDVSLESGPLERLAVEGQLMAYRHEGFWQCMDTPHDRSVLEDIWQRGAAPWRVPS